MGFPKMVHIAPEFHAFIKKESAKRKMNMAGFVTMCVLREVNTGKPKRMAPKSGKKPLVVLDDTPMDSSAMYAPFWKRQ